MKEQKQFYTSKTFVLFQIATFALTILLGTQLAAKDLANNELVLGIDAIDESMNAYGGVVDPEDC